MTIAASTELFGFAINNSRIEMRSTGSGHRFGLRLPQQQKQENNDLPNYAERYRSLLCRVSPIASRLALRNVCLPRRQLFFPLFYSCLYLVFIGRIKRTGSSHVNDRHGSTTCSCSSSESVLVCSVHSLARCWLGIDETSFVFCFDCTVCESRAALPIHVSTEDLRDQIRIGRLFCDKNKSKTKPLSIESANAFINTDTIAFVVSFSCDTSHWNDRLVLSACLPPTLNALVNQKISEIADIGPPIFRRQISTANSRIHILIGNLVLINSNAFGEHRARERASLNLEM